MNKTRFGLMSALAVCAAACVPLLAQDSVQTAAPKPVRFAMDRPVQNFTLVDVTRDLKNSEKEDDALISLSQFKDKRPVLLFFMSEKCGTTWKYEQRMGRLQKQHNKDVAFLGVRCSANDTPESIRKWAESKNFDFPILNDEKGRLTSYFKVTNTPTFVVIDRKGVARYRGSFDDAADEPDVTQKFVPDAINAVLADKDVKVKENRPFG
jgi:peroxiredoxin